MKLLQRTALLAGLFWALTLSACQTQDSMTMEPAIPSTTHEATPASPTQATTEACAAQGGSMRYVGLAHFLSCVIPYADAGKLCSDSSQCQGNCQTAPVALGTASQGRCSQDSAALYGCYSEVHNGIASAGLCRD